MPDGPPRSAYEIAMAKLAKRDAESGEERTALTAAQREAIADIRREYEAKVAECRILHQSRLAATFDPTARRTLEEEYRRDIERYTSLRDKKVAAVTTGDE